jgi:lincosamide nucleotidyltransferase A/C/D/E
VLDRLQAAGVRVWLAGGWGVDALVGRATRPHADIDLVLAREALPRAELALEPLGFCRFLEGEAELPAFLILRDGDDRRVDLQLVVFDRAGNAWQKFSETKWGLHPADGLQGSGTIGGRSVPCVTPELQLRHHLGYEWDENDRHDLGLLAEEFGLPLPPDRP